jgi:hypothetical protein
LGCRGWHSGGRGLVAEASGRAIPAPLTVVFLTRNKTDHLVWFLLLISAPLWFFSLHISSCHSQVVIIKCKDILWSYEQIPKVMHSLTSEILPIIITASKWLIFAYIISHRQSFMLFMHRSCSCICTLLQRDVGDCQIVVLFLYLRVNSAAINMGV